MAAPGDFDPEWLPGADPGAARSVFGIPLIHVYADTHDLRRIHAAPESRIEIPAEVIWQGESYSGAELEIHGGISRRKPKKSYRLKFDHDDELRFDLFAGGGAGETREQRRIVLNASWNDPTWLRNKLTLDAHRALEGSAPASTFVFLSLNDELVGLYVALERVDRQFLVRTGHSVDSTVYKAEQHAADWLHKSDFMAGFKLAANEDNAVDALADLLRACSLTPLDEEAFEESVEPLLDVERFMKWQLVHTYAMNQDTYLKNYYLIQDPEADPGDDDARFDVVSWDADATWGMNWLGEPSAADDTAYHGTDGFSPRLFAIPEYRDEYFELYEEALEDTLHASVLVAEVDSMAGLIRDAAAADLTVWQPYYDFNTETERLVEVIEHRHSIMSEVFEELD